MQKIFYVKGFFDYKPYLSNLNVESINKLESYYKFEDKFRSFISEWFKYVVVTNEIKELFHDISFSIYEDGFKRPHIKNSSHTIIDFNISHSGEYVVLALNIGSKIGIDIEFIDQKIDYIGLSDSVFTKKEIDLISSPNHFFNLWSKKESLIKAVGSGFLGDFYTQTALNHDEDQNISYNGNNYQFKKIKIDESYSCYCCLENIEYDEFILSRYEFAS